MMILTTSLALLSSTITVVHSIPHDLQRPLTAPITELTSDVIRVPVTLAVMSRCPDAFLCEDVFDQVLTEIGHEKIDLGLTFIGRLNESEPTYGVNCLHGPGECLGNIHELCTIKYTSSDSQKWWPFLTCLNHQPGGREAVGTDAASRHCAQVAGIDWTDGSDIERCVRGEEGKKLLKDSVHATQALGIQKSCTILISSKIRCIHDSTWQECVGGHKVADFVDSIEAEYDRLNEGRTW